MSTTFYPSDGRATHDLLSEMTGIGLVDRTRGSVLLSAFFADHDGSDPSEFLDFAVRSGVLTRFQADLLGNGEGHRIAVGPYLLHSVIGPSTLGTTYLAGRGDGPQRYTVVVLPLRSIWNAHLARKQVDRFGTLPAHPGILPLLDIDTANGMHYLAWPNADGETVAARVNRNGPLPLASGTRFLAALAGVLAECHRHGIAHGTLRPAVVQFAPDDTPRLLDLGIGTVLAENIITDDSFLDTISTATATTLTIDCCAPETNQDPTHRTPAADQYALGCLAHFVLTGNYPFPDGTVVDKMIAHATREAESLSDRYAAVPAVLAAVISRLLKKTPGERFPDMVEAASAFRDAAAHCPDVAAPGPTVPTPVVPPGAVESIWQPTARESHPTESDAVETVAFDLPPAEPDPEPVRPNQRDRFTPRVVASVPRPVMPEPVPLLNYSPSRRKGKSGTVGQTPRPGPRAEPGDADLVIDLPAPVAWASPRKNPTGDTTPKPVSVAAPPQSSVLRSVKRTVQFWKTTDVVQFSLFGPTRLIAGQSARLQVFGHIAAAFAGVRTLARACSPDVELLATGFTTREIPRRRPVRLHVTVANAGVSESPATFTWLGQTHSLSFDVFVPWESPAGRTSAALSADVDGGPVAEISIRWEIAHRFG